MSSLLETSDLVTNFYTYEGVVQALNRVSIVVDHGSTLGLVGESGCGKSVTVRSVMRIVQAPGRIEGGKVVFLLDEEGRQKAVDLLQQSEAFMEHLRGDRISMVFQEPNAALNPTLSIGDQVSESFLFHRKTELAARIAEELSSEGSGFLRPLRSFQHVMYRLAATNPEAPLVRISERLPLIRRWQRRLKKEAGRRSVEILGKLGIPHPAETARQFPHNLSGGMKQRVVIAIALACNPVLLIADEATSNLDVTIQAQILELLRSLKGQGISSILLITHDLGVVAETCDRVGVMYAGNVCEVGSVHQVFENPLHPYTRALLDSVPKMSTEGTLKTIEGNVPNLVDPPSGCRFHPRCPYRMDVCSRNRPDLMEKAGGHSVACHLYP